MIRTRTALGRLVLALSLPALGRSGLLGLDEFTGGAAGVAGDGGASTGSGGTGGSAGAGGHGGVGAAGGPDVTFGP